MRLHAVVLYQVRMRMRFTITFQQLSAVQDADYIVVGFDPDDLDKKTQMVVDAQHGSGEQICSYLPKAIYVNIDECENHVLPPAPCFVHRLTRHDTSCLNCIIAVQPGIFAVRFSIAHSNIITVANRKASVLMCSGGSSR